MEYRAKTNEMSSMVGTATPSPIWTSFGRIYIGLFLNHICFCFFLNCQFVVNKKFQYIFFFFFFFENELLGEKNFVLFLSSLFIKSNTQ